MNKEYFSIVTFSLLAFIILGTLSYTVLATEQAPVPEHLKLKASKQKILGSKNVDWIVKDEDGRLENKGKIIKYAYNSNININSNPSNNVLTEARKNKLNITEEVIERRTKHSKTFRTNNPSYFVSEFISGVPQYYKDGNGEWWQAEYATTTIEAFNQQTEISLMDKLFRQKALATELSFYPDPSETDSVDGSVWRSSAGDEDWTVKKCGSGDGAYVDVNDSWIAYMGSSGTNWNSMARSVFTFKTDSIPDYDNVASSTLHIYGTSKTDAQSNSPALVLHGYYGNSTNSLSSSDFNFTNYSTTTRYANDITYSNFNDSGWNYMVLNDNGLGSISKTGHTKLAFTFDDDFDDNGGDSEPSGSTSSGDVLGFKTYYSEETGTTNDPKLVVLHETVTLSSVRKDEDQDLPFETDISENDDNDLKISLDTGKSYVITGTMFAFSTSNQPDIKIGFATSSDGVTMDLGYTTSNGDGGLIKYGGVATEKIDIATSQTTVINISGTVKTTTAGTVLTFQWVQNASKATPITIKEGSYLRAEEI